MPWEQQRLTGLRRILAELYPRDGDQRRVVDDSGLKQSTIAFDRSAENSWHGILREANARDRVDAVLDVAIGEYPDNELLQRARDAKPPTVITGPDIKSAVTWHGPPNSRRILEELIGNRSTLASVSHLELGLRRARSVAKIRRADGSSGSGFLVRDNLLITNHHVLPDAETAGGAVAQFNYQQTIDGTDQPIDQRALVPAEFFATSADDDWSVIRVAGNPSEIWGTLELRPAGVKVGSLVNIIQHPGGGHKQISIVPSVVVFAGAGRVQYLTDTLPGSSGSPVFDQLWNLIALHQSGGWLAEPGGDPKQTFLRNEGILIDVVLAGLDQAAAPR